MEWEAGKQGEGRDSVKGESVESFLRPPHLSADNVMSFSRIVEGGNGVKLGLIVCRHQMRERADAGGGVCVCGRVP